ncbi:hypothetical protein IAU60_000165 [Kwoniella sp. DSM 27419]
MPPPPLSLQRGYSFTAGATSDDRTLLQRDRQLPRPIPIEGSTQRRGSDLLDSQASSMSHTLQGSPPAMTSTSASSVPTPYSIRTPAPTAQATRGPIIQSPRSHEDPASPTEVGIQRTKSFPHNGDLLGRPSEASGSRSTSLQASPLASPEGERDTDVDMDQEPDRMVLDSAPEQHLTPAHSAPPVSGAGSLTRLLQEIGNPPQDLSVYEEPPLFNPYRSTAWDDPFYRTPFPIIDRTMYRPQATSSQSQSSFGREHPHQDMPQSLAGSPADRILHCPALRHYHRPSSSPGSSSTVEGRRIPPSLDLHRYEPSMHEETSGGSGPSRSNDRRYTHASPMLTPLPTIPRLRTPPTPTSAPLPVADFRTLPNPAQTTSSSGSPGALERRIDSIEGRLDRLRARGNRTPPLPVSMVSGVNHENQRSRPVSRPYDLAARGRNAMASGSTSEESNRRSSSGRRPTWAPQQPISPTVPPPRLPNQSTPYTAFSRVSDDSAGPRAPWLERDRPRVGSSQSFNEASSDALSSEASARPWYLQQRMMHLDALRTGPIRPSPTHAIPTPPADDMFARRADRSAPRRESPESTSFRHAFGTAVSDTSVHTPAGPFGIGGPSGGLREDHDHHASMIRPSNRRWMSFDEGTERESSRERERVRDDSEDSLDLLNRDIHEAVGRRLSNVRPRATSIAWRPRQGNHGVGPHEVVGGEASESAYDVRSSQRQNDVHIGEEEAEPVRHVDPGQRQRTQSLWGEVPGEGQLQQEPRMRGSGGLFDPFLYSSERAQEQTTPTYQQWRDLSLDDGEGMFLERLRSLRSYAPGMGSAPIPRALASELSDVYRAEMEEIAHAYARHSRQYATALQITPEMDDEQKTKIVRAVLRGMPKLPAGPRKKAAEGVLETVLWGQFGEREGMARDEYCSVCHDEYEDEIKVAVTPCKHMYHQDCLDTWLNTPNTSSCPMCRRDLAALACLGKMVPSKTVDEALPLWMNAAV